jgi:ornithine cyclodeaminase/alanine dehydrogenase-like protein (mu-crystallin family)
VADSKEEGVLVLTNDVIKEIVDLPGYIDALDMAFRQLDEKTAQNMPRMRLFTPLAEPDTHHWYNVIAGVVPGAEIAALRVNSGPIRFETEFGNSRMTFPGGLVGLVHLFDVNSGALRAIIHDFYINPIRVACTSALGARHLARPDSKVMALLGSGWQARWHLSALMHVRPFEEIRVFSPNSERCSRFVEQQQKRFPNAKILAAKSAQSAVEGADVTVAATNSITPVMEGTWIKEGSHVISISGADRLDRRKEIDDETVCRSALIIINSFVQLESDQQSELLPLIKSGRVPKERVHELSALASGRIPAPSAPSDIRFHFNNTGMGIQFAAIGAVMLNAAIERGLGSRLPYTWRGRAL